MRKYVYPDSLTIYLWIAAPLGVCWLYYIGTTIVLDDTSVRRGFIPFVILLYAAGSILLIMTLRALMIYRPLSIDEHGISTYIFGRRHKRLNWSSVVCIERRKNCGLAGRNRMDMYSVVGKSSRIQFNDRINRVSGLLSETNRYAKQHKIPLFELMRKSGIHARLRQESSRTEIVQL